MSLRARGGGHDDFDAAAVASLLVLIGRECFDRMLPPALGGVPLR